MINLLNYRKLSMVFSPARLMVTLALIGGGASALAQVNGVWSSTASGGVWSGTGNWVGGNVATAGGNADFSQVNITANPTAVHLDSSRTIGNLIFGDSNTNTAAGWLLDDNGSGGLNILTLAGAPSIITVNPLGGGNQVVLGPVLAGTTGLTLNGVGILDLTNAETLAGGVTVNSGTLQLDSTAGTTTVLPSQALTMGGGTLNMIGNVASPSSQTFSGTTFSSGGSVVSAALASGVNYPTMNLGTVTDTAGASVEFMGPAYDSGATGASTPVAGTAVITVGAGGTGPLGLPVSGGAGYATVNQYDWASTDTTGGTAGTSIIGGSQVAGFYTVQNGGTMATTAGNYDITASTASGTGGAASISLRFNTAAAVTFTVRNNVNQTFSGALVTPNVAANNVTFVNQTTSVGRGWNNGTANNFMLWQNNTSGELIFSSTVAGITYMGGTGRYIQSGPGTVSFTETLGIFTTGGAFLNGGVTMISNNNQLNGSDAGGSGATDTLNGGTLVANYTGTMNQGAGATAHPIALGGNGGGLGATAGNTFTVPGVISGAAGTGPLIIGIPASANNGNVLGQIPGTGTGTANAQLLATGTVLINGGGSGAVNNTYPGGTVLDSGILPLNYNNLSLLGTGGITLNGGTFQWGSLITTDISTRTMTVAGGGGTLDVQANTVNLANAIGNGGNGALTVASTGGGGRLNLNGGATFTGLTTINSGATLGVSGTVAGGVTAASGATLVASGTIAGNLTLSSGAAVTLTQGSALTVSGSGTFANNTVTVNVPGAALTTGVYTVLTASSITGGSTINATPTMTGSGIAGGYTGSVAINGNLIQLTVSSLGTIATWSTDVDGNWSDPTKWTPSVPNGQYASATLGTGTALRTVTLNANETVGSVTFNNNNSFVISNNANTLTFDNGGNGASISASGGTANVIAGIGVALSDNLTATASANKSVSIAANISNTSSAKTVKVSGPGKVVLSGNNTYGPSAGTVGTTLSGGGTLQVGSNNALSTGDVSATASTLQAGAPGVALPNNIALGVGSTTVDNNGGLTLTLNGVVSGSGNLMAANSGAGTGKVILSNALNSYAGPTTAAAGAIVSVAADGDLGTAPGSAANNVILNGGDLLASSSFSLNANRTIGVGPTGGGTGGNGYLDAATGQTLTVAGQIASAGNSGNNNLIVNGVASSPGTVLLNPVDPYTGGVTLAGGTLQLVNSSSLSNAVVTLNAGTFSFGSLTTAYLGGLSGTSGLSLTNGSSAPVTLNIGENGATATYLGNLGGSGSLIMAGNGSITIGSGGSGGASYTGATTVIFGTLTLGGVGSMTATGNFSLTGTYSTTPGAQTANIVDNAVVALTGSIILNSASGSAGTQPTFFNVSNNASVSATSLSFGGGIGSPTGAAVTLANNGSLTINNNINLFSSGGNGNTTVNLNGGTLTASNFVSTAGSGTKTSVIHFNGGVLAAGTNDPSGSTFLPALAGLTVTVTNGTVPAYIKISANLSDTIAANLVNTPANPDAGLVKFGPGTLALTGNNTYNGLTTVSNGALFIASALQTATESFKVNDNKTFGVINNPGSGQSAQIVNLTLGSSTGPTTLVFTNVSDTSTPVLNLNNSGTLTLNGNCTLKIADDVNLAAGNEYPLIGYGAGSIVTNSGTGFHLALPTGVTGVLTNDPNSLAVALIVTSIAVPPPSFSSIVPAGADLMLNATGGAPGASLTVLSTTDLTLPLAAWTVVTTGNFDGAGNFSYTVSGALSSGLPQQFYTLHTP